MYSINTCLSRAEVTSPIAIEEDEEDELLLEEDEDAGDRERLDDDISPFSTEEYILNTKSITSAFKAPTSFPTVLNKLLRSALHKPRRV
jgi:hypothetical protein